MPDPAAEVAAAAERGRARIVDDYAKNLDMRDGLREPFDPRLITKVNKGFGPVDTINHAVVTDRLNKVAPGWTMGKPQFLTALIDGQEHVMAVLCDMTIGTVTRWEVGEVEHPSSYGDEAKKAMSDWIKRAAMRFGVGLDLWSKEDMNVGESTARKSGSSGRDTAASPTPVAGTTADPAAPAGAEVRK